MPAMRAAGTPDEAGEDPPSGDEFAEAVPGVFRESVEASREPAVEVQDGQGGPDGVPLKAGIKPPPANAAVAGDVEMHGPSPSAPSHVGVPSTPVIHVDREEFRSRLELVMLWLFVRSMRMKNSNFVFRKKIPR